MNAKSIRFAALFLLCCLLVPLFSGCGAQASQAQMLTPPFPEPEEITYNTITVESGTIERFLSIRNVKLQHTSTNVLTSGNSAGILKALYTDFGEYVKAGDLLAELYSPTLERQIYKQQANVRLAELTLKDARKSGSATSIERAEIQLDLAQYELDLLEAELEAHKIYAPIDGKIVYATKALPGDEIPAGETIFQLADLSQMMIWAKGIDTSELYHGNQLEMAFNQTEGQKFTGRVVQLPSDIPYGVAEDYTNVLKIFLDEIPEGAKFGEYANVVILLERKENVVLLQHKYISSFGSRKYVRVLNADGEPEERTLVLGIDNGVQVEIVSGLEAGEQIIV